MHTPQLNQQWLAAGLSARERAERAWRMRHTARLEARAMMADPTEVELLRARDMALYGNADGPTFAFLIEQGRRSGFTDQAIYEAIIEGAYRTVALPLTVAKLTCNENRDPTYS